MKNVLVTGSSSGIGFACVKHFLAQGCRVTAHVRSEPRELTELLPNDNLTVVTADFSSKDELATLLASPFCSEIDILVNNAGTYFNRTEFASATLEEMEELLRVNVLAPLLLTQTIAPYMAGRRWGRVINISSVSVSHGGAARSVDYTLSKASIEAMTTTLAKTFTKDNVLINAVRVGFTDTKFHELNPNKNLADRLKYIPLGRAAAPDEIAEVVGFLGTSEPSFMAGAIVPVTGGEK